MNNEFSIVDSPLIEHVIDHEDAQEYRAGEYVSLASRDIAHIRMEVFDALEKGVTKIICSACHCPVYPKRQLRTAKFHFAHIPGYSNEDCEYRKDEKSRNIKTIDAMRYNGQKEGPDHKLIKGILKESIEVDTCFEPNPKVEKNWYGVKNPQKWRRPDIAATRHLDDGATLKVAFEIQLSSTYLKVIAERRKFYLEESALLFWIFKEASCVDPRQYQDDLFYNNNSNIFVVDEETHCLSKERGALTFRCYYYEPALKGIRVRDIWQERFVTFDELTIDKGNQRVYYFDYEGERNKLLEKAKQIRQEEKEKNLRERYEEFWISYYNRDCKDTEGEYRKLRQGLSRFGISIPKEIDREMSYFNHIVYSAKAGKGVMIGYKTLLEVANNTYINRKQFLWYFGRILEYYNNRKVLFAQDKATGSKKESRGKSHLYWTDKARIIQKGYLEGDEFKQNRSYDKLFFFLFPKISVDQFKEAVSSKDDSG